MQWYLDVVGPTGIMSLPPGWRELASAASVAIWIGMSFAMYKYISGDLDGESLGATIVFGSLFSVPGFSLAALGVAALIGVVMGLQRLRRWNLHRMNVQKLRVEQAQQKEEQLAADYREVVQMINGEIVPEYASPDGTIGIRGWIPNPDGKSNDIEH